MNVSLYQAAAALNANARWQEVISQNLASAMIPGFKKQELSFSAVEAGMMPTAAAGGVSGRFEMPAANAASNFQQGEIKYTGVNTDIAIEGSGFFAVQLPNGDTAYTRDGEFQLNAQGQVVTKQGYAVLSDGGPIQMDLNNPAPLSIAPTGEVSQGTDLKGTLQLADFKDSHLLTDIGNGYYLARDPNLQTTETTATLRQGYLEGANTSAVAEMAQMITAMRNYEANQKIIQMQDDRMSRVITELGNPNPA
jgi:flagellar basal-body rod protein FlgF